MSRAQFKIEWKAEIILVAAANPCPCGWYLSLKRPCLCPSQKIQSYLRRISGPLLDRIDIHYSVEPSDHGLGDLLHKPTQGTTEKLRARVEGLRAESKKRNHQFGVSFNRELKSADLKAATGMSDQIIDKISARLSERGTSLRSVTKILRVARTLADIEAKPSVMSEHIDQALAWQFHSEL